jgi:hypothetical protein
MRHGNPAQLAGYFIFTVERWFAILAYKKLNINLDLAGSFFSLLMLVSELP